MNHNNQIWKNRLIYLALSIFLGVLGCKPSAKNEENVSGEMGKNQAKDSTYFFVRSILNASPKEVVEKLGNPDRAIKSSKWIEIQRYDRFDEDVIQRLGFPKLKPTFAGSEVISWRGRNDKINRSDGPLISIPGIIEISVAKSSSGYFIQVKVESDYNNRF